MKSKAVFLDRDGTVIKHVDFLTRKSELRILSGVPEAIKTLNEQGFLIIIITNQPVIARGLITLKGVERLHGFLVKRLRKRGAVVDAIYFCPHHPKATLPEYRKRCHCRKPRTGMLKAAIKEYGIDPKKSFMVGDALIDIVVGKRAHLKTILAKTGPGHERLDKKYKKIRPDFTAENLTEAARLIMRFRK